jgi:hypothetical protein
MTEEPAAGLGLGDVLAAAAEGLEGVSTDAVGDAITWFAGPAPFAVLTGGSATFRLDPQVARAALRTPGTATAAELGPDWLTYAPSELDDEAVDRIEAWFLSAYRRVRAKRIR